MSKDIIYREDAIEAIRDVVTPLIPTLYGAGIKAPLDCEMALRTLPSADRPQGWVDKAIDIIDDMERDGIINYYQAWELRMRVRMKGADDE